MMRTKPSSAMQKTYDECYLICSTAIYFESQNNEAEALRSWRNALDQIYYHNAYRVPANYKPKNETEKALQESLRQLELQCKERVDLLEALRQSREEAGKADESNTNQKPEGGDTTSPAVTIGMNSTKEDKEGGNWLGNGTVPPMDYTDLSRPPPLPKRPSVSPRTNSSPGPAQSQNPPQEMESREPFSLAPLLPLLPTRASRSPSPEKRSMLLRTLRPHGKEGRSSKLAGSLRNRPPAAAKAATQAWGSLLAAPSGRMKASPRGESLPVSYDSETQDSLDGSGAAGSEAYAESAAATSLTQNKLRGHRNKSDPPSRFRKQHIRPSSREESQARQQSSASSTDLGSGTSSTGYDLDSALKNFRKPAARGEAACNQARQNEGRSSAMRYDPHTRSFQTKSFSTDRTRAPARHISNKTTNKIAVPANTPSQGKEESHDQSDPEAGPKLDQPSSISRSAGKFQPDSDSEPEEDSEATTEGVSEWDRLVERTLATLPRSIDIQASRQILNEIIIHGDEVHWSDIAGLDVAKAALKETVVYPFLRPDLFMGLREPARGMLLFGPPGTGKTMLARAVATESKSTFFAISASSLTSKFLGESEKLVRALFALARALAPSIIFVDEIDSLLSSRSEAGEHETTRRIKTEFLIQWSDLARAAAGREQSDKLKEKGDASRVLVLAATNLPWVIDEAARRRFVRRQYIPLPEAHVRKQQLETLLSHQKHTLSEKDLDELVELTNGFSGSDITALAKDAAMGPLRSLGEDLLHMDMEDIRPIEPMDFKTSLYTIRPSVSKDGLKRFEDWAKEFGERGG